LTIPLAYNENIKKTPKGNKLYGFGDLRYSTRGLDEKSGIAMDKKGKKKKKNQNHVCIKNVHTFF
jgi:hypothetical protein